MSEYIVNVLHSFLIEGGAFIRWCMLGWLFTALFHTVTQGLVHIAWLLEKVG